MRKVLSISLGFNSSMFTHFHVGGHYPCSKSSDVVYFAFRSASKPPPPVSQCRLSGCTWLNGWPDAKLTRRNEYSVGLTSPYLILPVAAAMDPRAVQALFAGGRRQAEQTTVLTSATPTYAYEEQDMHVEMRAEMRAHQEGVAHQEAQLNTARKALEDQYTEEESDLSEASVSSDGSAEDDVAVEDSVLEDMNKFEGSFKGIAERYRLIKRIGEGRKSITVTILD